MLRPSYSELMEVLNQDRDLDNKITSRYTIVIAAAKRARQIVNGAECDVTDTATDKAVSIAISELGRGLIKLFPEGLPKELEDVRPVEPKMARRRGMVEETAEIEDLSSMEEFDEGVAEYDDLSSFEEVYEEDGFADEFDGEE